MGAPSPLERHTDTVSNGAAHASAATPSLAATAFQSRAPSRWVARPSARASAHAASTSASGITSPLSVFSSASTAVTGWWYRQLSVRVCAATDAAVRKRSPGSGATAATAAPVAWIPPTSHW